MLKAKVQIRTLICAGCSRLRAPVCVCIYVYMYVYMYVCAYWYKSANTDSQLCWLYVDNAAPSCPPGGGEPLPLFAFVRIDNCDTYCEAKTVASSLYTSILV
jgi:hypothetical protein